MNLNSMKAITYNGDPYLYLRATTRMVLYSLQPSHPIVIEPGEYIILDRYFNTGKLTEAQMTKVLEADYKRFQRNKRGISAAAKQIKDQK